MLSTETRLRLEDIANRIRLGENVSYTDMVWATKWAEHNRSAHSILRRAQREAIDGPVHPDSLDGLLHGLDIGDPYPSNHLIGPQDPDDLADFFKAPGWTRRD